MLVELHGSALNLEYGVQFISMGLLSIGIFLLLSTAVGLIRMPDFFCRLHSCSLADTMGILCIIGSVMLQHGWTHASLKLCILAFFLLLTGPTITHVLARMYFNNTSDAKVKVMKQKKEV